MPERNQSIQRTQKAAPLISALYSPLAPRWCCPLPVGVLHQREMKPGR